MELIYLSHLRKPWRTTIKLVIINGGRRLRNRLITTGCPLSSCIKTWKIHWVTNTFIVTWFLCLDRLHSELLVRVWGHQTETLVIIMYAPLVLRAVVRLLLLAMALNGLDLLAADNGNFYLNHNFLNKVSFVAGDYFVKYNGCCC